MYKNCREELLAVMRAFVIETGENEFSRAEAIAAMRRSGGKYPEGTVSAHLTYRCCANIPTRCYKPMYDDYEKIGNGKYKVINWETEIKEVEQDDKFQFLSSKKGMTGLVIPFLFYGLQPVECIGVSPNGEMEMCETINHLLCGWWAGAYSTITFPRYNRGVQATITERKGD